MAELSPFFYVRRNNLQREGEKVMLMIWEWVQGLIYLY